MEKRKEKAYSRKDWRDTVEEHKEPVIQSPRAAYESEGSWSVIGGSGGQDTSSAESTGEEREEEAHYADSKDWEDEDRQKEVQELLATLEATKKDKPQDYWTARKRLRDMKINRSGYPSNRKGPGGEGESIYSQDERRWPSQDVPDKKEGARLRNIQRKAVCSLIRMACKAKLSEDQDGVVNVKRLMEEFRMRVLPETKGSYPGLRKAGMTLQEQEKVPTFVDMWFAIKKEEPRAFSRSWKGEDSVCYKCGRT